MRSVQLTCALIGVAVPGGAVWAAEPVTVELHDRAGVGTAIVTIGDVAHISGSDALTRAKIAQLDLAELKLREPSVQLGRRAVEYRLQLAGFTRDAVRITGAERCRVTLLKRTVTADEVTAAAQAALRPLLPPDSDANSLQLAVPIVVKLPEVPAGERPIITAKPRGTVPPSGRVQMDVSIATATEHLLSCAVYLQIPPPTSRPPSTTSRHGVPTTPPPPPPGGTTANATASDVLIRPRQRVTMEVRTGELVVKALGEALQEGRLGQSILVQNVDSKKTITARVTGPQTVEVDIGGSP
ncbi:MAG: flagellar basal body P-ring formation chaperone FlgA [Gemmataceae bacterium]|nr:flagellar basal body P-ring formation chaperone FlgA [Gemmata sp.]MDW8197063.1 flagellar basal body P-ring formation chaperone FlgA [Gemmataceae bacterium]